MNAVSISYDNVLVLARRLDPLEQLRLLGDLALSVRPQITERPRRSILELRGLGKEVWTGVDAQAYVEQERASWVG